MRVSESKPAKLCFSSGFAKSTTSCRCRRCRRERKLVVPKLHTSPCPWCQARIDITDCKTRPQVRREISGSHLYVGGVAPPASRCRVKARRLAGQTLIPNTDGIDTSILTDAERIAEREWIEQSVALWRAKSPHCHLLSDKKLHEARRRGGLNQSREAKRQGGLNQNPWDKKKGGINSAAVRWGTPKV